MRKMCSVCMATYNGQQHIYEQVKSILDQMALIDELVVSDDGSTDSTIEILKRFGDNRIKIISNTLQKGPVGNFQNALMHAKGEIIFLADQDDKWVSGKLQTHYDLHHEHDLVLSNAVVVNEKGDVLFPSFFAERGSRPGLLNNLKRNSYIGCCMSVNRRILNLALPFPSYIHMHDWWIGLIAELKGKPVFCDTKLLYYLRHDNNASPTLGNSGYSSLKRLKNRLQLAFGLSSIIFK